MFDDTIKEKQKAKRDWVEENDPIICCVTCMYGKGLCHDYNSCMHEGKNKEYKHFTRFNENCSYSLWKYK